MMQVGRRRIDFVYEGRDSIEVKMPPPRHMREAALKARSPALLPSALMQAYVLLNMICVHILMKLVTFMATRAQSMLGM